MKTTQLMYATLMALTAQNNAIKAAPLSTSMMQGMVIDHNIRAGETVCCYYHGSGGILRLGGVPAVSGGSFFIDDNCNIYDYYNGYVRIRDGLSGELVEQNVQAYDFAVISGGGCCAYKIRSDTNLWRFYWPDGTYADIEIPSSRLTAGYHNGLLGISYSSSSREVRTNIYNKAGDLLNELQPYAVGILASASPHRIVPTSSNSAMLVISASSPALGWITVLKLTVETATALNVWEGIETNTSYVSILGNDQTHMYGKARLVVNDGETIEPLDEWVLAKWDLSGTAPASVIDTYTDVEPTFYSPPDNWGTIAANVDGQVKLYNISDMRQLYSADIPTVPGTNLIRETPDYIWISGSGVYQKSVSDWVMYPTEEYPRSSPWGRLGYAIGNFRVGRMGLAIVLFS